MAQEILKVAFKNGLIAKSKWGHPKSKPSLDEIIEHFKWEDLYEQ